MYMRRMYGPISMVAYWFEHRVYFSTNTKSVLVLYFQTHASKIRRLRGAIRLIWKVWHRWHLPCRWQAHIFPACTSMWLLEKSLKVSKIGPAMAWATGLAPPALSCPMQFAKTSLTTASEENLASFPGPRPASHRLQYGKAGEGLVHFLTWVTSRVERR